MTQFHDLPIAGILAGVVGFGVSLAWTAGLFRKKAQKSEATPIVANMMLRAMKTLSDNKNGLRIEDIDCQMAPDTDDVRFYLKTLIDMGFVEEPEINTFRLTKLGKKALDSIAPQG